MLTKKIVLDSPFNNMEQDKSATLKKAMLAYEANTLELRIVVNGSIQSLPKEGIAAEKQIRFLLNQGYRLVENETGLSYLTHGLMGGSPLEVLEKKLDTKPAAQRSVFITYQWNQKPIAQALQKAFEDKGYLVIRDEDTLKHSVYLPGFMKIIGHKNLDYVLPIISESYLKSKSCMYEVNEAMKRHNWEKTLLPYVVTADAQANAQLYSSVVPYTEYWEKELEQEKDLEQKEIIQNILRNIKPFAKAVTTRINVPEPELIATGYRAFFEMIADIEKENEGVKFKVIEEFLQVASISEKMEEHDEAKAAFESAIGELKKMKHIDGVDIISGKAHGRYGEYLLRQGKAQESEKHLKIAANCGYIAISTSNPSSSSVPTTFATPLVFSSAAPKFNSQSLVADVVQALLKANVDQVDHEGCTPLWHAVKDGNVKALQDLIAKGENVNQASIKGVPPLSVAIEGGHWEIVQILLKANANVNQVTDHVWTPLFYAINKQHIETIQALLKANANPNQTDKSGNTPLYEAVSKNSLEIVEMLLKAGANPNLGRFSPLNTAVERGYKKIIEVLLKANANPNGTDYVGISCLCHAAGKGNSELVETLLKAGANVNQADTDERASLWYAASSGNAEIVKSLLTRGAAVNGSQKAISRGNATPLYMAANRGSVDVVQILLEAGADKSIKTRNGKSPLDIAKEKGHADVVKILAPGLFSFFKRP